MARGSRSSRKAKKAFTAAFEELQVEKVRAACLEWMVSTVNYAVQRRKEEERVRAEIEQEQQRNRQRTEEDRRAAHAKRLQRRSRIVQPTGPAAASKARCVPTGQPVRCYGNSQGCGTSVTYVRDNEVVVEERLNVPTHEEQVMQSSIDLVRARHREKLRQQALAKNGQPAGDVAVR